MEVDVPLEAKESEKDRLEKAIKAGDTGQVRSLLSSNPKLIDETYECYKGTALHLAVENGHEQVVELLLKTSPKLIDAVDNAGRTALHDAAQKGHEQVAELLLRTSPKLIDAVEKNGKTALHLAAQEGHEQVAELLLKTSPKLIDAVDQWGKTALHRAAQQGHEQVAELLLKTSPKLIDAVTKNGNTALHDAAWNGHEQVAELLLRAKPELIDAVNNDGRTALHLAAQAYNGEKVAELLLKTSPKLIDAVEKNGKTALHLAAQEGHEKVVKLLSNKDNSLVKLLYQAREEAAIVQSLIQANTDLTAQLDQAREEAAIVQSLIQANTDLTAQLDQAREEAATVQSLIQANTDLTAQLRPFLARETQERTRLEQKAAFTPEQERLTQAAEDKKLHYPAEKIAKLLKVQLQSKEDVMINVLDLAGEPISEQQIQHFITLVMEQDKTLAIALHLHGEAWAGLVLKQQGDNLQLIYNDPTGNAFSKEKAVQSLINSITEHNHEGDTITTDLKQRGQNVEADSGAVVVDSLVRLATAKSYRKADLQQLLPKADEVNGLLDKHLLIEETSPDYSSRKLNKILEIALKDQLVNIDPVIIFEDKEILLHNAKFVVGQVIDKSISAVIPLYMQGGYWSGLVIKKQADSSLQVIYSNPKGNKLVLEKKAMKLIAAIMELNPDIRIIDIMYQQEGSEQASGVLIVNNLVKLAMTNTSNFHQKHFQELLATEANIDKLRLEHVKLLHHEGIPVAMPDFEGTSFEHRQLGIDALELKGNYPDGKEDYAEHYAPSPYEYQESVQLNLLGDTGHA